MIIQEVADEVLEAFKEYGLTPVRYNWIIKKGETPCACAVGALMVKRSGFDELLVRGSIYSDSQMSVIDMLWNRYGDGFVEGLTNGFDGNDFDSLDYNIEYYSNGYDTGKYIWNKLN